MKGLVIDEPWIGLILRGLKTWEMRKSISHYRGPVALIKKGSGLVVGTAELIESRPQIEALAEYSDSEKFHQIPAGEQHLTFERGWRTPWVLANIRCLIHPVPYSHPSGAVIWVTLPKDVQNSLMGGMDNQAVVPTIDRLTSSIIHDAINMQADDESPTSPECIESLPLRARVRRGPKIGQELNPHLHNDDCYVVSKTRFEVDYIRVRTLKEVEDHLNLGYGLRMSAPGISPSLISPASINGWKREASKAGAN